MPSSKTITVDNLITLGTEELARIIYSHAQHDIQLKRRLRLALAGQVCAKTIVAEVKKQLAALRRTHTFIDWRKIHTLAQDLDLQRETIVERIAPTRPDLALELLWLFMELAPSIFERSDDDGVLSAIFHQACRDLGDIARDAHLEPITLAKQTFAAITAEDYGQYEGLIDILFPVLGQQGVTHLKAEINAALATHPKHQNNAFDYQGRVLFNALKNIADQEKDIDAYIALTTASEQRTPYVATQIARRLLNAGRIEEAMTALLKGRPQHYTNNICQTTLYHEPQHGWNDIYLEVLDATNRTEETQTIRLDRFE